MKSILKIAKKAGFDVGDNGFIYHPDTSDGLPLDVYLECFAGLVRDEEREACAKVCIKIEISDWDSDIPMQCAEAIRARGE